MNLGLVMGGGGLVGIAWELGVLAGLQEAAELDPTTAAVIIGSSAGSVTGAQAALGRDLRALAERQQQTAPAPDSDGGRSEPRGMSPSMIEAMMSTEGTLEERAEAIGKLALAADVPMDEAAYVESFRGFLATDEWPDVDLRITTAEAETGRSVLWNRSDGIDLVRAVASSCAIPGFFPPVRFGEYHYVDGPRSSGLAALAKEKALDAILFVGPNAALPAAFARQVELDALADAGMPVVKIEGGEFVRSLGLNLMDPRLRASAAAAGLDDGRAAAVEVKALLNG